jgi:hypothetical protein
MKSILLVLICGSVVFCSADTFVDKSTGLIWQDNSDAKSVKKDFLGAKSYCKNLKLAGYSDWRLPNIKELQSIVDIKKYKPAVKSGIKNISIRDYYWSSTSYKNNSSQAWTVRFSNGHTGYNYESNSYYVRCVRGRQ